MVDSYPIDEPTWVILGQGRARHELIELQRAHWSRRHKSKNKAFFFKKKKNQGRKVKQDLYTLNIQLTW
jgi:hypothetical protein